jgi:hypothetical protein
MAVLASALFVVAILRARMPADAVTLIAFAVALAALSFGLLAPAARAATAEAKRDAWSAFARRVRAERQVMMPGRSAPDAWQRYHALAAERDAIRAGGEPVPPAAPEPAEAPG